MEITWRVISWEAEEREWGDVQGIRSINGRFKIDGALWLVWLSGLSTGLLTKGSLV